MMPSIREDLQERAKRGNVIACLLCPEGPRLESNPEHLVMQRELGECISLLLAGLTPHEEMVIKMRFGLDDGSEHTLEEVGQSFAVTRERIRQREAKALRKLRHPSRSELLRPYL